MNSEHVITLTLIHLTETANKLFVDFCWTKCKGQIWVD